MTIEILSFNLRLLRNHVVELQIYCKNHQDAEKIYDEMNVRAKQGLLTISLPIKDLK